MYKKFFLSLVVVLSLTFGSFALISKADDIDEPEEISTETIEETESTEEVIDEEEIENTEDSETTEESKDPEEETTESEEEDEPKVDDKDTENPEDPITEEDKWYFFECKVGEDDLFDYYVTWDNGLMLERYCKHCGYGMTEDTTKEAVKERFGVDVDKELAKYWE